MEYTKLQRQIALAVFHGAEVSKPYNDIKENGKVLLSGLYFYFPKPQLGEVDYCPSMYRNPGSLSKYETDFNWLMSVREKIVNEIKTTRESDDAEEGEIVLDEFNIGKKMIHMMLISYTKKGGWKRSSKETPEYGIYYSVEPLNKNIGAPKNFAEALFYAFSDFAIQWCISKGKTEFVELIKEKI